MTFKLNLGYVADEACRYNRLLLPARFLGPEAAELGVELNVDASLHPHDGFDGYTLHGLPHPANFTVVVRWLGHGKRFVWSIDDDFLSVPAWNPCKPERAALGAWKIAHATADRVLVSTAALGATLDRAGVVVAPNLIDLAAYPTPDPAPLDGPLRVLWAGSRTHEVDLAEIVPAVGDTLRRYGPGRVEFVFAGYTHPALARDWLHRGVHVEPGVDLGGFTKLLTAIRPHVVLAPLAACAFNESKSPIRVYDGWALSAAVVASSVGEYGIVRDGVDGLRVAAGDPAGWAKAIGSLVEDAGLREGLARAGRARVRDYDWNSPAARKPWAAALAAIAA